MKLSATNTFKREVTVSIPSANSPGKHDKHKFLAEFKTVSQDDLESLIEDGVKTSEFLDDILVSVEGIEDEAGIERNPDEALELVKTNMFTARACRDEFFAAQNNGGPVAKNSKRSRGR